MKYMLPLYVYTSMSVLTFTQASNIVIGKLNLKWNKFHQLWKWKHISNLLRVNSNFSWDKLKVLQMKMKYLNGTSGTYLCAMCFDCFSIWRHHKVWQVLLQQRINFRSWYFDNACLMYWSSFRWSYTTLLPHRRSLSLLQWKWLIKQSSTPPTANLVSINNFRYVAREDHEGLDAREPKVWKFSKLESKESNFKSKKKYFGTFKRTKLVQKNLGVEEQ